MREEFLKQLSDQVIVLVNEIEKFSGREITVHPNPHPVSPTDPNPEAMACAVSESRAQIYYRNANLDVHGFTHELLHIRRWWVKGIPQILPTSRSAESNIKVTSQIENSLEHLTIVPQEAQFGFDPFEYWNRTSVANWEGFDAATLDKFALRKNCLLGWLTINSLVTDPEVKRMAENKIISAGFLQEAKLFQAKINKYSKSKEKQISATVHFLRIPRKEVEMVFFDVQNGKRIEKSVAKYRG